LPLLAPFLTASLTISGCAKENQQPLRVIVLAEDDDSQPSPLKDPNSAPLAKSLIRAATHEGLLALDAEGKIIPAIAERWIITDDGQSYIFRLRDSDWADGTPLNGESVAAALRQAIANQHGTALALDLGIIADVRAMAGRVVELRLRQPMPDFLQLLAQPELGLSRRNQGAGPMMLKQEEGFGWLTALSPEKRGQPIPDEAQSLPRPVALISRSASMAVAQIAKGQADLVLGGSFADLPKITSPKINISALSKVQLRLDPVAGLFGLLALQDTSPQGRGLLATPRLREAVAMAIDRNALATQMGGNNWPATTRILPPGVAGDDGQSGERWTDYDLEGRRALARQRIADWVSANKTEARLRLALPQGSGADQLAQHLKADFATIGIALETVPLHAPADLRLLDEVARYPAPSWFFHQLNCAIRQPCAPAADALAAKALMASPAQAAGLTAQAEREYAKANLYIPLGAPIRWSLAPSDFPSFAPNRWGFHPLFPLANHKR